MRAFLLLPLLLAAGCGGGETEPPKAERAARMEPGQWEVAAEVLEVRQTDEGTPLVRAEAGDRATVSVCVGPEERVPVALFAGDAANCRYSSYYVRGGRINSILTCPPPRGEGLFTVNVQGSFEADSFEATRTFATAVVGGGNMRVQSRLTGRRTGECAAGGAGANEAGG